MLSIQITEANKSVYYMQACSHHLDEKYVKSFFFTTETPFSLYNHLVSALHIAWMPQLPYTFSFMIEG